MTGTVTGLLIGEDRITESSGGLHPHIYPATGHTNGIVALAGAEEIDRAITSGWAAHRSWMALTADRRRDLLLDLADAVHEHLDELAQLNVADYGVPISFAGTAILLERFLRHFAGYVDTAKAHQGGDQMGKRRKVATGTDAALAWDDRHCVAIEQALQCIDYQWADAGMSATQSKQLQHDHQARHVPRKRIAKTRAVREDEVGL